MIQSIRGGSACSATRVSYGFVHPILLCVNFESLFLRFEVILRSFLDFFKLKKKVVLEVCLNDSLTRV